MEGKITREPIAYSTLQLTDEDRAAVAAVLSSNRLVMGEQTRAFEKAVAEFTKRKHAIATSSGTTALHMSLHARGVGPGWKVFLPAYTWLATYNVVRQLGATPVLVDIDPLTYCMSREALVRAIATHSTGREQLALLPVHLFGFRCGEDWLESIAETHRLTVIGDACSAFGGVSAGQRCGAWAPIECFSFHPRKLIATGEGGMIVLDDDALAERLRSLRDHGAVRSVEQRRQTVAGGVAIPEFPEAGFNYRMTEMQGALGASQMARIDSIRAGRLKVGNTYDYLLQTGPEWLRPPSLRASGSSTEPDGEANAFDERVLTFYPVTLWGSRSPQVPRQLASLDAKAKSRVAALSAWRDRLVSSLAEAGVAARVPMTALSELGFVQRELGVTAEQFPNTYNVFRLTFALPCHNALSLEDMTHVVRLVCNLPGTWHTKEARDAALARAAAASGL